MALEQTFDRTGSRGIADRSGTGSRPSGVFDLNDLGSGGLVGKAVQYLLDHPQWLFSLLRRFWPIAIFSSANWALVTRFDDVAEVLGQDQIFQVPFGEKMMLLNGGPNFLLGMQDGETYRRHQRLMMKAFRREDVAGIGLMSARFAAEIVGESCGQLDAIQELITRVPVLICEHYYGIQIPDKAMFAKLAMAMSTFVFGDPGDDPRIRRVGLAAGERMRLVLDRSIAAAKAAPSPPANALGRLVAMQSDGAEGPTDDEIRAIISGMITGFVPTNTMAAGHMLEMLLRRKDFMEKARSAALAGDDDLLKRVLFEAMRFKPLNPGPFRVCVKDYTIARGTERARTIRAGMNVVAGTQSAMFDPRRVKHPRRFDPHRPQSDYMLFGQGLHWCIGAHLAEAQITQTFKALLVKDGLRRASGGAGRLQRLGPFPAHLAVTFQA